jgi:hypothetical protein
MPGWWRKRQLELQKDAWTRVVDATKLLQVDEVHLQPRPAGVGRTYVEEEFGALANEQELLWPADGERAARSHRVRARGLDLPAAATDFLLVESKKAVQQAQADYQHAIRTLSSYVRREPGAKWRYWLGWLILLLGDTAGVWSAAIMYGELPSTAFGQALAAGLAAACAGLIGAEVRDIRMAAQRRRDVEVLTEDERRYWRLFNGHRGGQAAVKLIGFLSIAVAALVAIGVGTLRSSVEGNSAGLTFGLLAAATALASALLGYAAADEVADLLAASAKRVRRAEQRCLELAASTTVKQRAEAEEAARSTHVEYQLRGQAAGKRMESLAWRTQSQNPQVVGHGYPLGDQTGQIGRRVRRPGGGASQASVPVPINWSRLQDTNHTSRDEIR